MTKEELSKANDILEKLEKAKENLKKISYTQVPDVAPRDSYLKFNGIKEPVEIPAVLFKVVGKLIELEYIKIIDKLQKDFDEI